DYYCAIWHGSASYMF
nr:immunoglobulin light chain junction region [Macaca mulatta]MOX70137.1 immunoglobulin light chain junction region [Macaca mulatta]MOX72687.1 immunoglobulin light chain junction region [Macaca mulatta]MOX72937.1 immunoglobulin light chain junction region [Macaca mulatta]MOX74659.1 immunoglobulin light chain junction region [Macaca mulatta]